MALPPAGLWRGAPSRPPPSKSSVAPSPGRALPVAEQPVQEQKPQPRECPAAQPAAVRVVSAPVRLFYRPSLMRAFNFSFTSSVTPTFNNTPCARQKFAPGNHGFDHKTAAGRRSWLTLSALQAVWSPALREIRWSSSHRGLRSPTGMFLVPLLPSVHSFGERGRGSQVLQNEQGCRGGYWRASLASVSLPPLDRPTVCSSLTLLTSCLPGRASERRCAGHTVGHRSTCSSSEAGKTHSETP